MSTHRLLPVAAATTVALVLVGCSDGGDERGLVLDGPADAGVPAVDPADPLAPAGETTVPDEPADGPPSEVATSEVPTTDVPTTEVATTAAPDPLDPEDLDGLGATRIGEGRALVTVDGVTYEADAQICVADPTSFTFSGPATGSDGTQAWVDVDRTRLTRAEAEELFDPETVEFLLGDAEVLDDTAVSVTVGRTEMLGSGPEDQPLWEAFAGSIGDDMVIEAEGSALRGVGSIRDLHGIGAPFDESVPLEFEAVCE